MKTISMRRANVILDVPEEQKQEYLAKGFDVIDASGNIVEYTTPSDLNTLKTAYVNHVKKIKDLEDEIKKLKAGKRKIKS